VSSKPDGNDDIIVDPACYELNASWDKETSAWARMLVRILDCVRRQTAALGIGAIIAVVWFAGARAQDTALLIAALGSIVVITVSAELIDGKNHDQNRGQGEAKSCNASQDKTVD
jgi:hypothetical protein